MALAATTPAIAAPKIKIGFIGAGNIGGTLAKFWADARYQVMISARDLGTVGKEAAEIGPNASAGTPAQAAAFGQVVVISVPWSAFADVAKDNAATLKGKVVIDTCNPNARDGDLGKAAVEKGAGLTDQALLPGAKLVRAFSSLNYLALRNGANRAGEKYGVPIGGDDKEALTVVSQLVTDAGFAPIVVGDLARSKMFDLGGAGSQASSGERAARDREPKLIAAPRYALARYVKPAFNSAGKARIWAEQVRETQGRLCLVP